MNKEIKEKWVKALRGEGEYKGRFKQGKYQLKQPLQYGEDLYCCLGVLCELSGLGKWERNETNGYEFYLKENQVLPKEVQEWAELRASNPPIYEDGMIINHLATLNDTGATFSEIADIIEKDPNL